jgi:BirA family biotin operon repressor/biotin-[acetyl-CoA-carboxylase] ligase
MTATQATTGEEAFDCDALHSRLTTARIGRRLHVLGECDSTNVVCVKLAEEGAPEGTIVLADHQTAGRGRLQRQWQSPPGCNVYCSILLRPAIAPADAAQITLTAGVAVAEMIAGLGLTGVGLKWPNDVRIGGRKVCGILTEMRMVRGTLAWVVVGIGLNVNMAGTAFDPAYRAGATSLKEETGETYLREEVAVRLCREVEKWYGLLLREGFPPVRDRWLGRSEMSGQRVRILFRDELQEGVVAGLADDGALLLADPLGSVRRITAGDATIMKG